jgi:hypothetical protein
MATRDTYLPLFDHTHGVVTTAYVVLSAAVGGLFAAWLVADYALRTPAFIVAALVFGYTLYDEPDVSRVVGASLYWLSALVALIPVMLNLPYVTNGGMPTMDDPWALVTTTADVEVFLVFLAVAGALAAVGYGIRNTATVQRRIADLTE